MTEEQLRAQLEAVYASTSWKITAPLRGIARLRRPFSGIKLSPKRALAALIRYLAGQAFLQRLGRRVFGRFPNVKVRLRSLIMRSNHMAAGKRTGQALSYGELEHLSPAAQAILAELKASIRKNNN